MRLIVISRSFDKRESGGGRWTENPRNSAAESRSPAEVRTLVREASPEVLARRAIDRLTGDFVSAILEEIDAIPSVPDPTAALAEYLEPKALAGPTLPPPPVPKKVASPPSIPKEKANPKRQRVKVKGDVVNIRREPSTRSQILGKTRRGEVFPLVVKEKEWVKIRRNDGSEGWIAEFLVEIPPE